MSNRKHFHVVTVFVSLLVLISICLMLNNVIPVSAQDEQPPVNTEVPPQDPTAVPPTDVPQTSVPPTNIPPTKIPPTWDPCFCTQTAIARTRTTQPPTPIPPTNTPLPPTTIPPTNTSVPPTNSPLPGETSVSPTTIPPTSVPPTRVPPTGVPNNVPPTQIPTTNNPGTTTTTQTVTLPKLGGNVVPQPSNSVGPICVDWMVYHTNQTGDWEVFRLGDIPGKQGANANLSQGVGANVDDVGAALSPDKAWVAFSSNRDGNFELYIGATDGSSRRRITNHPGFAATDPVWSPDNVNVVYSSNMSGNWDLYLVNSRNGKEKRLTNGTFPATNAAFSPDGNYIVFEGIENGNTQIFRLNVSTLEYLKLSDGVGIDRNPAYSPDGKYIAFYSVRNSPNSVLYIMNADGSNPIVASDVNLSAVNHSWSPDGSLLAYQGRSGTNLSIYVYQLPSKKTRQVTDVSSASYAPTWFCRGNTLIFTSDVTGDPNVFSTAALPIDAAPIKVEQTGIQLTAGRLADQYALASPPEEDASSIGPQLASIVLPSLGGEPTSNDIKCGDVTRVDVLGGGTGFPVINTNTCEKE
jgi:Tol biopolymer transport system component